MITLLLALLVLCVLYWAAMRLLAAFGVGDPLATIVQIVIVLIGLVWILSTFGVGLPRLR